jgi:hypothetical protein
VGYVKAKFTLTTDHEDPDWEKYNSTISLTSSIDGWGWVVKAKPRPVYRRERDPVPIF